MALVGDTVTLVTSGGGIIIETVAVSYMVGSKTDVAVTVMVDAVSLAATINTPFGMDVPADVCPVIRHVTAWLAWPVTVTSALNR